MAARMRTISQTVQHFREIDPDTCLSEWYLRQLVKSGKLKCHKAGNKYLINLDSLESYLENPPEETIAELETGKIRRLR